MEELNIASPKTTTDGDEANGKPKPTVTAV